ncbi:MAG: serine protein kinase RIO [Candidatus Nanoarchaeia archaeon]|nr:serine protein kinase RIO [Candidatus Nanoarchaeia archaeon]MDD5054443.1 serine protein kinase RIO [Candidatus Nanoarchaeia archaeon]MDD5499410.1 serine protein kinase RIO [Candidatus Nanoarchaeia archaeon]
MPKEIFKVYNEVFDARTLKVLEKLRKEYFEELESCISTGKEANVFRASAKKGFVAVKIFRMYTSSFDKMSPYILGDPRFNRVSKKKHEIIYLWAKKEFRNLSKAFESGVRVPKPLAFNQNVLVMEFIGENGLASPLLKDVKLENYAQYYDEIIKGMIKLYKSNLIHADLSEFNILHFNEKPVFIDMGQSVLKEHPNAMNFLKKDLHNINKFFEKKCKTISFEEFIKKAKKK